MTNTEAESAAAYLNRARDEAIHNATQSPVIPPLASLIGGGISGGSTARTPSAPTPPEPQFVDLFDVYEPIPAQCKAVAVTDANIHALAKFLRKAGDLEVSVAYDPDGATLLMKQESKAPPGGGPLLPGFAVSVRTGEMLVLYRESPDEPVVLHEGWNTVENADAFINSWRRIKRAV